MVSPFHVDAVAPVGPRVPFVFWSDKRIVEETPAVSMHLNAHTVTFQQGKRYARLDSISGTDYHHFLNANHENNDVLTVSFQGSTGNIDHRSQFAAKRREIILDLRDLTLEAKLYTLNGKLRHNRFYVSYTSKLFNTTITLVGMFSKAMDVNERAEKPFSSDYSMEFIVDKDLTVPRRTIAAHKQITPNFNATVVSQDGLFGDE